MKTYQEIKTIVMGSDTEIECIEFYPTLNLEDVTYDDGSIEKDDLLLTKDEVIRQSGDVVLSGYGTHSGRKVWQLPRHIKMQIKTFLSKNTLS